MTLTLADVAVAMLDTFKGISDSDYDPATKVAMAEAIADMTDKLVELDGETGLP